MKTYKDIPSPLFELCLFFLSLIFIIIYTYPLITNLSGIFYGFPWDSLGGIRGLWRLKFTYTNNLPLQPDTYLAYPFGQNLSNTLQPYLWHFIAFMTTYLTGDEIIAFNILKLLSFPLLALTAYLLVHYLTGQRTVSVIAGLIYAFSPYHIIHNMAHFANVYFVPLAILFLLKLLDSRGYKNSLLFGLCWGITFVDNTYYAYFIGLLIPVFASVYFLNPDKRNSIFKTSFLKLASISFLVFLMVVIPMIYPILKEIFFNHDRDSIAIYGLKRDFSDLFIFSARPLDYLLPSKYNLFLGWLLPDFGIGPLKGHRYADHTLYLGYSLILLAGYAVYCSLRKRRELGMTKEIRHTVYLFCTVAFAATILSAPPFIPLGKYYIDIQTREIFAEHKLYLPQYFLYKLFPMFRVYARMGAVVLLAVCILAAFGLREVLARINTPKMRYLFLSIFSLIIFIEYAEFPSFKLTKVQEPEVYKWLASQPGQFPIVEYPLGSGDDPYTTYEYAFYQRIHKKYLVNGAVKGTPADEFRKEVIDISKRETIEKLQKIGVRYVVIHKYKYLMGNEYVPLDWLTTPPRDKIFPVEYNNGKIPNLELVADKLKLVKDFGNTVVYEIIKGS